MGSPITASPARPSAGDLLRSLVLPVYLPGLFVQTAMGMLVPLLPLYLTHLGLSSTALGAVVGAAGIGSMLSQLPVGSVIDRTGERLVMGASVVVLGVTALALGQVTIAAALVALQFGWGVGATGWLLSRQTLMTHAIPTYARGRATALFGGLQRAGAFLGALLGGLAASQLGYPWAFAATGAVAAAGLAPMLVGNSALFAAAERRERTDRSDRRPMTDAFHTHGRVLTVAGLGQVAIITVRTGRQVILPLAGIALGLSPAEVGFLVGIGSFTDLALSPVAGMIMDHYGRLFAIVPAFLGIAAGLLVLAAADSYQGVTLAAVIIGLANAIGSGTMLTMASDLAPAEGAPQFLAALGTIRETGKITGPLVVGALADRVGLSAAAVVLAGLATAATVILTIGVGETRDRDPAAATPARDDAPCPS